MWFKRKKYICAENNARGADNNRLYLYYVLTGRVQKERGYNVNTSHAHIGLGKNIICITFVH